MNRNIAPAPDRLRIIQLNLSKSEKAYLDFINGALGNKWDVILIQEPYFTHLGHIRAPNGFISIFSPDRLSNQEAITRSVIWVNSKLSTNSWKEVSISGNNDLTAIQIATGPGKLTIFNIYNDCNHFNTLECLQNFLQASRGAAVGSNIGHMIWRGDFNCHHPLWDRDEDEHLFTAQAMRDANILIKMVANKGMEIALPKGEVTLRHMVTNLYSRPDNVWCSAEIIPLVIRCEIDAFLQPPCTDHFPIVTILDLPQERTVPTPTRNFRMVDWELFNIRLQTNLESIPPPSELKTEEEVQAAARDLMNAIQQTIKEQVEVSKPCVTTLIPDEYQQSSNSSVSGSGSRF
jgi:hypothetical protein